MPVGFGSLPGPASSSMPSSSRIPEHALDANQLQRARENRNISFEAVKSQQALFAFTSTVSLHNHPEVSKIIASIDRELAKLGAHEAGQRGEIITAYTTDRSGLAPYEALEFFLGQLHTKRLGGPNFFDLAIGTVYRHTDPRGYAEMAGTFHRIRKTQTPPNLKQLSEEEADNLLSKKDQLKLINTIHSLLSDLTMHSPTKRTDPDRLLTEGPLKDDGSGNRGLIYGLLTGQVRIYQKRATPEERDALKAEFDQCIIRLQGGRVASNHPKLVSLFTSLSKELEAVKKDVPMARSTEASLRARFARVGASLTKNHHKKKGSEEAGNQRLLAPTPLENDSMGDQTMEGRFADVPSVPEHDPREEDDLNEPVAVPA